MAIEGIGFSFDADIAHPIGNEEEAPEVEAAEQSPDGDEYICGTTGNAHPYANAGRDQDRSRQDEYVAAQGCARYVS